MLDAPPLIDEVWYRTIFTLRNDKTISMYSTVIMDGELRSKTDHGLYRDVVETLIDKMLQNPEDLPYVLYDFTKRDDLESQLTLIEKDKMPLVLGCTKDELDVRLSWKI